MALVEVIIPSKIGIITEEVAHFKEEGVGGERRGAELQQILITSK